ncbi:MAG: PAS domain-containing protein [Muribaculaceae bacterium]
MITADKESIPPIISSNTDYQTWMTFVYDKDLYIREIINPQYSMLLRHSPEELIGMHLLDLESTTDESNKKNIRIIINNIKKVSEEHKNVYFEYATNNEDNSVIYSICYATYGNNGNIYVYVIRIEEENIFEARSTFAGIIFESTMNNMAVGIIMRHFDDCGNSKYVLFNNVIKELFECDDIQKSKFWDQVADDEADAKASSMDKNMNFERTFYTENDEIYRSLEVYKKRIESKAKGYYIITTVIDITHREKSKIDLKRAYNYMKIIIASSNIIMWNYDYIQHKLFILKDTNFEELDVPTDELLKSVHPADRVQYKNLFTKIAEGVITNGTEVYRIYSDKHKDYRYYRIRLARIVDKRGELISIIGTQYDVSDSVLAENEIKQQYSLLNTIYSNLPVGLELYNKDGKLIHFNEKDRNLFDIPDDENASNTTINLFENPNIIADIKEKLRKGENAEFTISYECTSVKKLYFPNTKDGVKHFRIKAVALKDDIGQLNGYLLLNCDITLEVNSKIETEDALLKFKSLFDAMYTAVHYYDIEGNIVDVNKSTVEIFGFESREQILKAKSNLYENAQIPQHIRDAIRRGEKTKYIIEYNFDELNEYMRFKSSRNGIIYADARTSPVFDSNGVLIGTISVLSDITERIVLNNKLEKLYRQNETILQSLPVGVELYSKNGDMLYLNNRDCEIFGINDINEALKSGINLYNDPILSKNEKNKLRQGKGFHVNFPHDFKYIVESGYYKTSHDKLVKQIDCKATTITNKNGDVENIIFILDDITQSYNQDKLLNEVRHDLSLALQAGDVSAWDYDVKTKWFTSLEGKTIAGKGLSFEDIFKMLHKEDKNLFTSTFQSVINKNSEIGKIVLRFYDTIDNDFHYYECTMCARTDRKDVVTHIIGLQRDITTRMRMEIEMENASRSLDLAMNAANITAWDYDIKTGKHRILSKKIKDSQNSVSQEEIRRFHPDDLICHQSLINQIKRGDLDTKSIKVRIINDHEYIWYEDTISSIRDKDGQITHLIGSLKDITSIYKYEKEISKQKEYIALALTAGQMSVWIYDVKTQMFSSLQGETISGDGLSMKDNINIIHPDDAYTLPNIFKAIMIDKQAKGPIILRYKNDKIEGGYNFYESSIIPILDDEGCITHFTGTQRDITNKSLRDIKLEELSHALGIVISAGDTSVWRYIVAERKFYPYFGNVFLQAGTSYDECAALHSLNSRKRYIQIFDDIISRRSDVGHAVFHIIDPVSNTHKYFVNEIAAQTNEHNDVIYIYGTQKDITKDLYQQRMLQQNKEDLERSRNELNLALDAGKVTAWSYCIEDRLFYNLRDNLSTNNGISIEESQQYIHPDDTQIQIDLMADIASGRKENGYGIFRYKTKDDNIYHYYETRMMAKRQDGKITHITGTHKDITEEHFMNVQLIESKIRAELAIKTANLALWEYDVETEYFTAYNDPVNHYDSSVKITFDTYKKYYDDNMRNIVAPVHEIMQAGKDEDFTIDVRFKTDYDTDWQYCTIFGSALTKDKNGKVSKYAGFRQNNTKWVTLNKQLEMARNEAEKSDKLKSMFLANMSHEIRTPLNAIVGFSGLLKDCTDIDEREEYMNIIETNNELLLKLINDILDLSKIEAGYTELNTEEFDFAPYFDEIASSMQLKCTNPNIKFISENPYISCMVNLDKKRLWQLLTNFVTNAIKYTPKGHIKMGYLSENGGIKLYVEDTGIGVSKENYKKVFDRFEKLDDFAQGTGLGLSICKAIVETAGGKIDFETEEGKGSTFWAWIPNNIDDIKKPKIDTTLAQKSMINSTAHDSKNKGIKILVAEDNDSNYMLIKSILKNYNITRAINGAIALEMVKAENYDVILMDLKMPVMGGIEATKLIREFNKTVKIIAVTANAFDNDKVDAFRAGCNEFIAKPLKKDDLLNKINN